MGGIPRLLAHLKIKRKFLKISLDIKCTSCHSTHVIPFRVQIRPGVSLFEQIVYAAKRAMVAGQLRPGDPFPSVRALSKELKINPNTAHKIIAHLINEGLLETRPGIGTVVALLPDSTGKERAELLGRQIEELVVEAKRLGIDREKIQTSIAAHWQRLSVEDAAHNKISAVKPPASQTPDKGSKER
jgi:GntR family transcriptional regulator